VWGGSETSVEGTGTAIGTGASNTEKIVEKFGHAEPYNNNTDYAAKLCANLVVSEDGVTYDDWFLPSKDELNLMFENLKKNNIGGFSDVAYWSSSEFRANGAWYQGLLSGYQSGRSRDFDYWVRPVRVF